jgi:hypothetical protein
VWRRAKEQPLDEATCYERLHGDRDPNVRILPRKEHREQRPKRLPVVRLSGEDLRLLFEQRLNRRDTSGS